MGKYLNTHLAKETQMKTCSTSLIIWELQVKWQSALHTCENCSSQNHDTD